MKKAAKWPPFLESDAPALLAELLPAVLAAEPGAGDADEPVAPGIVIATDRGGGSACGAADHAGRDVGRPEAVVIVIAVVAVAPAAGLPQSPIPAILVLGDPPPGTGVGRVAPGPVSASCGWVR